MFTKRLSWRENCIFVLEETLKQFPFDGSFVRTFELVNVKIPRQFPLFCHLEKMEMYFDYTRELLEYESIHQKCALALNVTEGD